MMLALMLALSSGASGGALTLTFDGVERREGAVLVALYDSEAAFRTRRQAARRARVLVSEGPVSVSFTGLPPGRYAAIAFHDQDGDGRLRLSRFGLPAEPVAITGGRSFGPPSWAGASFELNGSAAERRLRLR